jgi:hypothetical protein
MDSYADASRVLGHDLVRTALQRSAYIPSRALASPERPAVLATAAKSIRDHMAASLMHALIVLAVLPSSALAWLAPRIGRSTTMGET